jgi:hypothetical protein
MKEAKNVGKVLSLKFSYQSTVIYFKAEGKKRFMKHYFERLSPSQKIAVCITAWCTVPVFSINYMYCTKGKLYVVVCHDS